MEEENKKSQEQQTTEIKNDQVINNNKSPVPMIAVLILFVIVVGVGFWLLFGGESKTEPPKEEKNNQEEVKTVALTEEDIKPYKETMDYALYTRQLKDELKAGDLTNQEILYFGYNRLRNEVIGGTRTSLENIKKEELKESIRKQLGNVRYVDETVKCLLDNGDLYIYSHSEEVYKDNSSKHGHGRANGFPFKYEYFQNAEKDEAKGIITINYKIIYGLYYTDVAVPDGSYYKTVSDSKNKVNAIRQGDMDPSLAKEEADKIYAEKKDELQTTTYTFKKMDNGDYVFDSVVSK